MIVRCMSSYRNTQNFLDSMYTSTRLQQLHEKARDRKQSILFEKFNDTTLNGISKSLKALDAATKGYDLNLLRQGIRTASNEIMKIMSGDKGGLLSRLKQLVVGNPIALAKIVAFEESIINGILQLPQVMTIITAGSDVKHDKPVIDTIDDEQRKNAVNMIVKALQHPLNVFSSRTLPYIQGNIENFAEQFLALTPDELNALTQRTSNLKRSVQDADLRQLAQQTKQKAQAPATKTPEAVTGTESTETADTGEETSGTKLTTDMKNAVNAVTKSLGRDRAKSQAITQDQATQIIAALDKLPLFAQKENDPIVEPIRQVIKKFAQ